ncbi:MAG: 4Fe-4S binding protein [Candidatus Thermoplasmatota archaeon]|nr:4Fe-4S binding protein [Candidatus Thermoplasmatota archaeon]
MIPLSKPKKGASGKTGMWRTEKPVLDKERCTNCLLCWVFCPESAIYRTEDKIEIDYEYCKGCGVCADECARGAIKMEDE